MPHSWHYPTGPMLDYIHRCQPSSVLDIGAGFGKWGYLARDLLDFNSNRLTKSEWHTRIVGIEAFTYESPLHEWAYDEIWRTDVLASPEVARDFDLVILGDVIEHFPKDAGRELLQSLVTHNRNVAIATPRDFFTQEIAGNEFEQHLSHWTLDDFASYRYTADIVGGSLCVLVAGRGASYPGAQRSQADRLAQRVPFAHRRGLVHRTARELLDNKLVGRLAP